MGRARPVCIARVLATGAAGDDAAAAAASKRGERLRTTRRSAIVVRRLRHPQWRSCGVGGAERRGAARSGAEGPRADLVFAGQPIAAFLETQETCGTTACS